MGRGVHGTGVDLVNRVEYYALDELLNPSFLCCFYRFFIVPFGYLIQSVHSIYHASLALHHMV